MPTPAKWTAIFANWPRLRPWTYNFSNHLFVLQELDQDSDPALDPPQDQDTNLNPNPDLYQDLDQDQALGRAFLIIGLSSKSYSYR